MKFKRQFWAGLAALTYIILAALVFSLIIQRISHVKRVKSARSYVNLGDAAFVKSDFDKAISDYNEAIRLNPKNATAYLQRGLANVMKMDLDMAIADFSESIRLNSKNATTLEVISAPRGNPSAVALQNSFVIPCADGAADKIPQTEFFAFFCCFGIWHAHILLAMNPKPTPQSLLNDIAQIQRLDRGTVSVLRQGPQGPYYNHQCYEKGRNVSRYVPAEQVPDLQAAIDGYRRVQELMAQYVQLLVEQTRAERAAGAKKKTQRPNFSWPKSRKSNS